MVLGRPHYLGMTDTNLLIARMLHALLTASDVDGAARPG
jgi:hypothetical protein